MSKSVVAPDRESPLRSLVPFFVLAWILIFWARFFFTVLPGVGDGEIDRVDILFAVPEIVWSNLFPERLPGDSSSWVNLVQRIPILGYALFMLLSAVAMGRLILRGMNFQRWLDRMEQAAFSGGLGFSLLSLITLSLGVCGVLSRGLFFGVMLTVVVSECFFTLRNRNKVLLQSDQSKVRDFSLRSIAFLCIVFLVPMLLGAMLPSTDFDVKEYHLEGPKEFFLAGNVHFLPHNVYTSFPFLTEMLTLCGMVLADDWFTGALVGKTVLMAFAPITAMGIFAVGRRVAGDFSGGVAALVYLSTPWTYRISVIAYTEGAMCCYVILSVLALIIWFEQLQNSTGTASSQRGMSLLCGLLAGSTIATKYPGMVLVAIPVAFAMLLAVLVKKISWRQSSSMAALYILGGILTFGPWVAKNYFETENPVYPLMYSVFGGEDWDAELNEKWKAGHARPSPVLKNPGAMAKELKKNAVDVTLGSVWQSPLMFGLAPLAFLYRKQNRELWIVVGAAFTILSVWYTMTHLIDRFWVPVLPVIAVLSGVGITAMKEMFFSQEKGTPWYFSWLGKATSLLILVTIVNNLVFMTTPACGYNAYLIDDKIARQQVKPASVVLSEQAVGDSGRVLFVGEAMVFDAECEYRYNTVFDHSLLEQWTSQKNGKNEWELLSAETIEQNFQDAGITHILINWNEILRYRTTYGYTDFVSPERIKQLSERCSWSEVSIPDDINLRDWETIDDSWKGEIERWGPELKRTTFTGEKKMKQYQLFELSE